MSADKHFARNRLLQKYDANSVGEWEIYGEDPNCDLGGYHHEPFLEKVSGRYLDVVEYALSLPRFFDWGSGGDIKSAIVSTRTIPQGFTHEQAKKEDAKAKIKELESEIAKLKEEFKV
jgi:hypothetical protein